MHQQKTKIMKIEPKLKKKQKPELNKKNTIKKPLINENTNFRKTNCKN